MPLRKDEGFKLGHHRKLTTTQVVSEKCVGVRRRGLAMAVFAFWFGVAGNMLEVRIVNTIRTLAFIMGLYRLVTVGTSELQIAFRNF
jgi:hypothetical protein